MTTILNTLVSNDEHVRHLESPLLSLPNLLSILLTFNHRQHNLLIFKHIKTIVLRRVHIKMKHVPNLNYLNFLLCFRCT